MAKQVKNTKKTVKTVSKTLKKVATTKVIKVKNADGDADTTAKIVVQNQINYTPKVSVIIPVYNVEKYLHQCLDSVVNQTLREIEIICVDDGSTDNSMEILKEYAKRDNRITVLSQKNLHAGVARNAGLTVARGEYLSFLDSDDFFESNMLEKLYKKAVKGKSDIIVFNYNLYDDKEKRYKEHEEYNDKYIKTSPFSPEQYADELFFIAPPNPWTKLFKHELIAKNNIKFENCISCNDITFVDTALSCSNKIIVTNDIFAHYRINSNTQISKNRELHATCILYAFEKLRNNLTKLKLYDKYKNVYARQALVRFYGEVCNASQNMKEKFCKQVQNVFPEIYNKLMEKLRPAVSVIIPVYNTEKYLAECLDSVINQTLTNIEIICVNDGSTDGSLKILQEYAKKDNRIKIITQQNKGLGATRNVGIDNTFGQYVTFLDSDDYINPCYCEVLYNKAVSDKADIAATGKMVRFDSENNKTEKYLGIKDKDIVSVNDRCKIFLASGTCCNKIYKTDFIKSNAIHMFDRKSIGEDNIFTIVSCVYANKIAVCNKAVYYYRINPKSITNVRTSKQDFDVIEMYLNTLDKVEKANISQFDKSLYIKAIHERMHTDLYGIAKSFEPTLQKEFYNKLDELFPKLIISLTSYPARIGTVHQTIETLLNQTMKADKVILWLAPEQFPNRERDLPKELLALCDKGLTIDWYHDIKSYKKLIPALQKYPEAIIITTDDDCFYDSHMVENLYNSYLQKPNCIHCNRAHKIRFENGKIAPYKTWGWFNKITDKTESFRMFFTGVGGVLYPPHCLRDNVLNESEFMSLCPQGDDIWFWANAVLNGFKIKYIDKSIQPRDIEGTQETALWLSNINNGKNDKQIAALINKYPQILTILVEKQKKNSVKPYLFLPYYLIANLWMEVIKMPLLKFKKHIKQVLYSHSHRGKMDMLNMNFRQIMQDIESVKHDTINRLEQLDTKIKGLEYKNNKIEQMLVNLYSLKNNQIANKLEFRTFGDLAHCIRMNLHKISNNIDLVVGVPRSGMIPAYMIALFMNKKCCSLDEFISGIESSNGFRNLSVKPIRNVLIVDDSIYSGNEMARVREKLSKFKDYDFKYMAVYARTESAHLVDIYLEIVDGPRVWQWNYLNHNFAKTACFDMDGVLCVDPTDEQNDDGDKYKHFILTAKPLYIPNYKIRAIVTSRLEKYRDLTEKWLADNGVQYDKLIMLNLPSAEERRKLGCHASFKADIYQRLTDTKIFIESNPEQAKEIAARTGKQVLCVANDELY